MAEDKSLSRRSGYDGIPMNAIAIVQHDTNELSQTVRGIWCNAAGDVKVKFHGAGDGTAKAEVTFTVAAGTVIWGFIDQVFDTGTTLTNAQMIGLL